jgi:hypothetical protein
MKEPIFFVSTTTLVLAVFISINYTMNLINAFAQENDNKGKFIMNIKLADNLDIETNNISFNIVNIYVKEHPKYGHFGINLDESM